MQSKQPFWLRRPTQWSAVVSLMLTAAAAAGLAAVGAAISPLSSRASLPLERADVRALYLSTSPDDSRRVMLTRQRADASTRRAAITPIGGRYWYRTYGDPDRPGIPDRRILNSRNRGARLLIPVAALDLERALKHEDLSREVPHIRRELVFLYEDLVFRGLFLELRFPRREELPDGEPRRFDLVAVRGSQVLTVDWVLQPYPRYYRSWVAEGEFPVPPSFSIEVDGEREVAFVLYADMTSPAEALYAPLSLFRELELAWGERLGAILDERWRPHTVPLLETRAASAAEKRRARALVAIHRAARFEDTP